MMLPRPQSFVHLPLDGEVLDPPRDEAGRFRHDHEHPIGQFQRHAFTMLVSREMMLDCGLAEPTPEEAARRRAELIAFRADQARRNVVRARWLAELLDRAGDVGRAVLRLHKRDRIGDCRECTDPDGLGRPWPCPTVEATAAAVGLEIPEGV